MASFLSVSYGLLEDEMRCPPILSLWGATVGLEALEIDTQGTLVLKNLWGPVGQIIDLINLKKM